MEGGVSPLPTTIEVTLMATNGRQVTVQVNKSQGVMETAATNLSPLHHIIKDVLMGDVSVASGSFDDNGIEDGARLTVVVVVANALIASGCLDNNVVRVWSKLEGGGEWGCVAFEGGKSEASSAVVAWSPTDDDMLVSGFSDGDVKIWSVSTGDCVAALTTEGGEVNSVAWSPADGSRIAVASANGNVQVYEEAAAAWTRVATFRRTTGDAPVVWSPTDGDVLASGGGERLQLWSVVKKNGETAVVKNGNPLKGHSDSVLSVAWSSGGMLASGSRDLTTRVWSVSEGGAWECAATLRGHIKGVTSVAWSPAKSDDKLASGSGDGAVRVWSVSQEGTWECMHTLEGHQNRVYSVAWLGAGLASGSADKTIRVWSVSEERWECVTTLPHTNFVKSVATLAF